MPEAEPTHSSRVNLPRCRHTLALTARLTRVHLRSQKKLKSARLAKLGICKGVGEAGGRSGAGSQEQKAQVATRAAGHDVAGKILCTHCNALQRRTHCKANKEHDKGALPRQRCCQTRLAAGRSRGGKQLLRTPRTNFQWTCGQCHRCQRLQGCACRQTGTAGKDAETLNCRIQKNLPNRR